VLPETRAGLAAAFTAYAMWGLLPAYLKLLTHLPAGLVLAHRIVWSVPAAALVLWLARDWAKVRAALTPAVLKALAVSSLLIGVNWAIYVWAVGAGRIIEASLGYFLNPLVNVALGVFLLRERLSWPQGLALTLAAAGVANQMLAVGQVPWVALTLCGTFAAYGLMRKRTVVDARAGLMVEAGLLAPLALGGLALYAGTGTPVAGDGGLDLALLVLAGPVTAVPLILFAFGARRLRLSTLGLLQYIAPTGQMLLGLSFGEPFTPAHAVTFGLIWSGLALYSFTTLRAERRAQQPAG
jgi:chloramphenicol-sensitive protein RarD